MSKQQLLTRISSELDSLNIPYQTGATADISVSKEFLDAGWSTGNKKVTYETSIFANETSGTVFMWEMTKEKGSGFSFGSSGESYSQSGTTLYRKVKSTQNAPDGKVYEYTLDLGAIPKSVKSAAKEFGWNFKTVIHKSKASYPAGYSVSVHIQQTQQEKPSNSFCTNCGSALGAGARFCTNCGKPV